MKLLNLKPVIRPKLSSLVTKSFNRENSNSEIDKDIFSIDIPSVNISDEKKVYKVDIPIPGFDKRDVTIEVQNGYLVISSEKKHKKEDQNKNWLRKEYSFSSFRRVLHLPENADADNIKAKMKNGILTLKVSKKKKYKSKNKLIIVE